MLTASNVYLDGPTSPVPSYTTLIPKYSSVKWEKTWARVLHSSYQHLIRKKVWKSLNRWHLWMALGQIWVTQSHLHTTDVNISKFQPSTASGLGGVRCLRSKMPATLYRYRSILLTFSVVVTQNKLDYYKVLIKSWCYSQKMNASHMQVAYI